MSELALNFQATPLASIPTESQTMSEIVLLHHNEPMTTSLAIAEGVEMDHHSVLILLKKHIESLSEFGRVEFEIQPFDTNGGKQWRDVYFLSEQQATLLITFMRNSPLVIKFKIALVKAFFELRDRATAAQQIPNPNNTLFLSHAADIMVAADRTFRSVIRASRSAGMKLPAAIRRANAVALQKTGICMLDELQAHEHVAAMESTPDKPEDPDPGRVKEFWETYELGGLDVGTCLPILTTQAYALYKFWCMREGFDTINSPRMIQLLRASGLAKKTRKRYTDSSGGVHGPCAFVIPVGPSDILPGQTESEWLGECVEKVDAIIKNNGMD